MNARDRAVTAFLAALAVGTLVLAVLTAASIWNAWTSNDVDMTPSDDPGTPPAVAPYDPGPTAHRTDPELSEAPTDVSDRVIWYWPGKRVCVATDADVRSGWGVRAALRQWNAAQSRIRFYYRGSCVGYKQRVRVRQYKKYDHRYASAAQQNGRWVWYPDADKDGEWLYRTTRVTVSLNMYRWGQTVINNGAETPWSCQAKSVTAHEFGHVIGLPHLKWNAQPAMVLGTWYDQTRFCGRVKHDPNARPVNTVYRLAGRS